MVHPHEGSTVEKSICAGLLIGDVLSQGAGAQAAKRSKRDAERQPVDAESDSSASRRGRKLWEEVHTVHYHRYSVDAAPMAVTAKLAIHPAAAISRAQ